jgi:probable HAF family extracellular repeat protein
MRTSTFASFLLATSVGTFAVAAPPPYTVTAIPQPPGTRVSWQISGAINNNGAVAGTLELPGFVFRAFIFENGTMSDLGTLGGEESFAADINDHGDIVGRSLTASGGTRAFLYSDGIMRDLGIPLTNSARSINNRGQIVGTASAEAFVLDNDVLTYLGTLGGTTSAAYAISENGIIVGEAGTGASEDTVPRVRLLRWGHERFRYSR